MVANIKSIGATGKTSKENIHFYLYNSEKNVDGGLMEWGCCSSIKYKLDIHGRTDDRYSIATHTIMRLGKTNIPSKFLDEEFLLKYCKFFNQLDDKGTFNITYLGEDPKNFPAEFKVNENNFSVTDKYIYIAFNMQQKQNLTKLNLAQLSWVRFLQFSRYWFYADNMMTLRDNPDLESLNNFEILQLASYGENKARATDIHGLWHYKSPMMAQYYSYYIEEHIEEAIRRVKNGQALNSAFTRNMHIYDIRHIKKLFREGEFVTIYNMLIQPVISNRLAGSAAYVTVKNDKDKNEIYTVIPANESNMLTGYNNPKRYK